MQYDCPVVWLTEHVKDSTILVVGANVSEIDKGYERIYVVALGDGGAVEEVIRKVSNLSFVKSYEVIQRKRDIVKLSMVITKTRTMEASVTYDATPLATWVAIDGFERWTLGFHTYRQLRDFVSRVSEYDYIERSRVEEVPDILLAINYASLLRFTKETLKKLSDRQIRLLNTAIRQGYYEWPRLVNIGKLAKDLGVSRVAVAKLLRKAEKGVIFSTLDFLKENKDLVKNVRKALSRSLET